MTRTLCKQAFDVLYDAIINDKPENYPYGSMLSGMGFGNCSTTLGHALSYVFSNEGVAHGYSLSSCTTVAHKHNNSIFYEKFKEVIEKLGFDKMKLKAPVDEAADVVMTDKGHLDPNPIPISKDDVIKCLNNINDGNLINEDPVEKKSNDTEIVENNKKQINYPSKRYKINVVSASFEP